MLQEHLFHLPSLLLLYVAFQATYCKTISESDKSRAVGTLDHINTGGLRSILEDAVSPAFGATIIIILTVVVSGSAYLCFLKYVCAGCCTPMQVVPTEDLESNKVEEQV